MSRDYSAEAQDAAERRIVDLEDALADQHDEYAGLYCGCWTCVVRTVIDAAWPILYDAAHDPDVPRP